MALCAELRGYTADAVVQRSDRAETAIVVDRSAQEGSDPTRHLMLRHKDIRAEPDAPSSAVRIPAWVLYNADRW